VEGAGFRVDVLHRERNARTKNVAATVVTLRATKLASAEYLEAGLAALR
jgi:hypothetical protein